MTSSRFSRRPRVQPTPKICHVPPPPPPPPPPPVWPPLTATAFCKWEGFQPPLGQYYVEGTCQLTWVPADRRYVGTVHTAGHRVEIRCNLAYGNHSFFNHYDYYSPDAYMRSGYSYHHDIVPGEPIILEADFWIRPDYVHHVIFNLPAPPPS